jgi:beta-glucosidase
MPVANLYKPKKLQKALDEGLISLYDIDDLVRRFLRVMHFTGAFEEPKNLPPSEINGKKHQTLARIIGEQGTVLLKNEGNLLPLNLDKLKSVALLGPNLKKKFGRLFYGGSSAVTPPYEITPLDGMKERLKGKAKIVSKPDLADIAIVFAGLNHSKHKDSEFNDRKKLELPDDQVQLIQSTVDANPNTIVVMIAGSPIAMNPWLEKVPAVLLPWYSGMEGGRVIANVLFGDVNPSGKLPITFPRKLSDSPAHHSGDPKNYPGDEEKNVYYDEQLLVGYRWFDEMEIDPLFPFGFGQSYTAFEIGNVGFEGRSILSLEDSLTVNVDVTNTGNVDGSEIVQIYSHDDKSSVLRPPRELVGFGKIKLGSGESGTLQISIMPKDFALYDFSKDDWVIERGDFELHIGTSSRDIKHTAKITYD